MQVRIHVPPTPPLERGSCSYNAVSGALLRDENAVIKHALKKRNGSNSERIYLPSKGLLGNLGDRSPGVFIFDTKPGPPFLVVLRLKRLNRFWRGQGHGAGMESVRPNDADEEKFQAHRFVEMTKYLVEMIK